MRPKIVISLFIIALTVFSNKTSFATTDKIYIVESLLEKDIKTAKSRLSLLKTDGTKLDTVTINGILARISPDGGNIAYMERSNDSWELALADSSGKKIRNLPAYVLPDFGKFVNTAKLVWSPDGEKIAILQQLFNREIFLNILFLKNNEIKKILSLPAQTSEEAYFYSLQWLRDSREILIGGANGLKIVDINTTVTEQIAIDSAIAAAYLVDDDKKILAVVVPGGQKTSAAKGRILLYDLKKRTSEEILSLEQPPLSILSYDNRYLVFNYLGEPGLSILDLLSKKVSKKDTKGLMMILKKFSPSDNNLIICLGSPKGSNKLEYGIFNIERGEFKLLIEASPLQGESGMLLLMGFDWVDWR